jgi:hypothetical protein
MRARENYYYKNGGREGSEQTTNNKRKREERNAEGWICATRRRASSICGTLKWGARCILWTYSLRYNQAVNHKHDDERRENTDQEKRLNLLAFPQFHGRLAAFD